MDFNGIPLSDPVRPKCGNCRWNVEWTCAYKGYGNSYYGDDWQGRKITWSLDEHCGQHQYNTTTKTKWMKP